MIHLDEGAVATLRDERPTRSSALEHLAECATCTAELAAAKARSSLIAQSLATLDAPVDVSAAKARVRARLDRARLETATVSDRSSDPRGWTIGDRAFGQWAIGRWPIGKAAAILVLTAGAASAALTLTPLSQIWRAPTPTVAPASGTAPAAVTAEPITSSIAVGVGAEGIDVSLDDAAPGASVVVAWVDGTEARIVAPRGSSFTMASGSVEVEAAEGPIRLELPRDAARASVTVNGRVYLQGSLSRLEVLEPAAVQTDDQMRFVVHGPAQPQ